MARRSGTLPSVEGSTFGDYLRLLRRRARLTQTQLGIAVGYSDAQICRLEMGKRLPDVTTVVALFFPALDLDSRSVEAQRLLELAAATDSASVPSDLPTPPLATTTPTALSPMLPAPPTSFVGRARELNAVVHLVRQGESRLITLLGSAGIGKTRLALQVAHHLQPHFPDGLWFVDLTAVESAEFVPPAVAQVIGLESEEDPADAVQQYLRHRKILLVLDNLEQVRGAGALLAKWLTTAPGLTPANTLPIAAICVRVDGVPLALELVAAHGRLFTPQELLTEIARQFVRLRRRGTDAPARHQSVTAALAWSRAQLPPEVQTLFARLSIFANGWMVEGAVATDGGEAGLQMVGALSRFWYTRGQVREGRQWVGALLATSRDGVPPEVLANALVGAGMLAYRQSDHLQAERWYRDALTLYEGTNNIAGKADILRKLGLLEDARGDMQAATPYFEASLVLYQQIGDEVGVAQMLHNLGNMANQQNDFERAIAYYRQTLAVYHHVGDESGVSAVAQLNLGDLAADRGNYGEARRLLMEALGVFETIGDQQLICNVQIRLGSTLLLEGDGTGAIRYYRQSLMLANGIGYDGGITEGVEGVAACMAERHPTMAARLFGFATMRRRQLLLPVAVADQLRLNRAIHLAQNALTPTAWEKAWVEGEGLIEAQAVKMALATANG